MGRSWGVVPAVTATYGYVLIAGRPVSATDVRLALGLSHAAVVQAFAQLQDWGLLMPGPEAPRTGRRGPLARTWTAAGDPWTWFPRVIRERRRREGDPDGLLAFDHRQIIDYALWRLASKAEFTPLLYRVLPDSFTLGDLRRLWELVTNRRLDPSNFAKRVLSQGMLAPLPGAIDRRTRRPARLYRYVGPLEVPGAAEQELTA